YWSVYDKATTGDEIAKATSAESITRNLRRLVQAGLVTLPRHKKLTQMAREYTHEFHALS
ncbi:MAG: hypothetical protein J7639_14765, partial [Paenibacillaceae bacterium]|nr:hypothetical protein [Paenibacillaceae bacterium]